MMCKAIAVSLLAVWLSQWADVEPILALDCKGKPPELVNKDSVDYEYSIQCARKTEKGSISANSSKKLKKKGGCTITLGDNPATKLHSEMICTIEGGELTCELL